jgi:hypothetical protein
LPGATGWSINFAGLRVFLWDPLSQAGYSTTNGTIIITGYTGPGGAWSIPDTINGLPVTSIASILCASLTSVTIPNGVTNIGDDAFQGCTSLTAITVDTRNSVYSDVDGVLFNQNLTILVAYPEGIAGAYTIPNSVTSIGDWAFNSCSSLTSVTIGTNVTSIGDHAFNYCTGLTNITIPNSVTGIGVWAFSSCARLTSVTIPNSVTGIGVWAFSSCARLTSVTIPNSVSSIEDHAFDSCNNLTNVTIGNSVTSIGDWAFYECYSLTSVTIPASVTNIGDMAFSGCGLTSVTIPNSVTSIGTSVFSDCSGLTSVTIPNSVTSIGGGAFYECSSLTSVTIPNSVTNIGGSAFWGCRSLTGVTIPASVTSIGYQAFEYCTGLTSVTIPASVTNIGDLAFDACGSLTAIAVDTNNPAYSSVDGVLFDKSQTTLIFCPQGMAGTYTIPNSVTGIGDYAFFECGGLTSVTIPDSVTSVGQLAFYACTRLTSVAIPASVTGIGDNAFTGCYSLTAITVDALNPSYSSLDGVLFNKTQTTLIRYPEGKAESQYRIPNSVTSLGDDAFAGAGLVASVYFQGNAPSLGGSSMFNGAYNATAYYLPGTTGWSDFSANTGVPTALWFLPNPLILSSSPSFGVQANGFGFIISWATNIPVVVEACTNPANHTWRPLATNTLTSGSSYFSDPAWTNYRSRFYRLRSP